MINDKPGSAADIRADMLVDVQWLGAHRFDAGRPGGPTIRIDADSKESTSPPEALLSALATCTAVDVVDILTKRRTVPVSVSIAVTAERRETSPRRITKAHLAYTVVGGGVERAQAERAIELAVTKYCTVRESLDPEMPVTWSLELKDA